MAARPLAGRSVVTTRDVRGRLDRLLARAGADVVHVPLISIRPVVGLDEKLARLGAADWLIVTSQHGAAAVGAAAAAHPTLRLAAVGASTASTLADLAGRAVDVVPSRQTAHDLAEALPDTGGSVVLAQADRADRGLADRLVERGFDVEAVVAYHTELRMPTWQERAAALSAGAVAFASGSAAEAWADAIGEQTPAVTVAIGPTTAAVARGRGLKVSHVATDHDVDGLVHAISAALASAAVESVRPPP